MTNSGNENIQVAALEWAEVEQNWWTAQPGVMINGCGYEVRFTDGGHTRIRRGSEDWNYYDGTPDEAKAFWQEDFSQRILSTLIKTPSPTATQAIRMDGDLAAVLEEMRQVAIADNGRGEDDWDGWPVEKRDEVDHWQARIRNALSDSTDRTLDERMKAAGMYTVAEMMDVTPLSRWTVQAGMTDLDFFGEWLDRKTSEYIRMKAAYDLGDKDESDELYEWVLAHSGAFSSIRENYRAARSSQSYTNNIPPAAWRWESAYGGEELIGQWQVSTIKPSRPADATDFVCDALYLSYDKGVKHLVDAVTKVLQVYATMEDGNGDPCPDIAALSTALADFQTAKVISADPHKCVPDDVFAVTDCGNHITLHFSEIKSARGFRDTFSSSIVSEPKEYVTPKVPE